MTRTGTPADLLLALEDELDARAVATGFAGLPRRTFLAMVLGSAHELCHGSASGAPARPAAGRALLSRLGYLTDVVNGTDRDRLGADAADALTPLEDTNLPADAGFLFGYAHLCEWLPEVHRGWWEVSGDREAGFVLSRPSADLARFEARDIVLSELVLTTGSRPPIDLSARFDAMAAALPQGDRDVLGGMLRTYVDWFLDSTREEPLLTDAALQEAFQVSLEDFRRFRAAWMAWAELSLGMTAALRRRLLRDGDDPIAQAEYPEWVTPCFEEAWLTEICLEISGVPRDRWDRLVTLFEWGPHGSTAGDGFFPPLHRLGGSLLFSADAVQTMMPMRNLAYVLNRLEPKTFDDVLSRHLEPALLETAAETLRLLPGVEVALNVQWGAGEIDLVAVDLESPSTFHVEAKAALPPQGARMTQATKTRALEGLRQIAAYRDLDPAEQRRPVATRFPDAELDGAETSYGLLTRSCFGTAELWEQLGDVVPFNLPLLRMAVGRLRETGGRLRDLPETMRTVLDAIVAEAAGSWTPEVVDLGVVKVSVPLLDLDEVALHRHRLAGATAPGT